MTLSPILPGADTRLARRRLLTHAAAGALLSVGALVNQNPTALA